MDKSQRLMARSHGERLSLRWLGFAGLRAAALGLVAAGSFCGTTATAQTAVTTYHNDNARTGWNADERVLNYANVSGRTPGVQFKQLYNIPLDAVTFAQPLVVPNVVVTGDPNPGTHDVVYEATYNNTIYAIDPTRGTVLLTRNLGTVALDPCNVRGPAGVLGTPVIDLASKTMYLIAHIVDSTGAPQYVLHAVDLGTLADKLTPVVITAKSTLSDGSTYVFDPTVIRQRPALLEANGNIYAGFGGSCDVSNPQSPGRGWVIGWSAATLAPLKHAELTDRDATEPNNFFHTAVWMSGAGLAGDTDGSVFFVTGNSDPSGTTYSRQYNLTESVVKLSGTSGNVVSTFTPSNYSHLDQIDLDFGSGGVTLLPLVPGSSPLAVATGKEGGMYLMNRTSLGGYTPPPGKDNVYGVYNIGPCTCTEAAFTGAGTYVVSGGGNTIGLWQVHAKPTPGLTLVASSPVLPNSFKMQGYFPTVTSRGAGTPIVWVVTRPVQGGDNSVSLYAIEGAPAPGTSALSVLFSAPAGVWNYTAGQAGANANISAVVANGYVYVSSDHELTIFGLASTSSTNRH